MADAPDLAQALAPTYRLERELGGGGMSRVFVAVETALNRRVAIKVVPVDGGAQAVERFRREISTAAQLQHPHIVPVLTAGEANGVPWFAMPYVAGESLRARIAGQGALPVAEATKILRDIAQALAYAHAQGFVHRDIKPDNVLLADGAAVVTDFGVAKALSSATNAPNTTALTGAGMALGTPAYMAPEQVSADPQLDHRADLYAWGCVAYELLTGSTPFGNRAPSAIYAAHITEAPKPVRATRADVPESLARLVEQCLAKMPGDRPQSARELLAVIDGIATPAAIVASATKSTPRGLMVLPLVALLLAAGWWWRSGTAAPAVAAATDRSIVVLPFDNAARDTAQEYFADGVTEDLIGKLAESGMRVIGRNTAFSFKGKHPTPQEAGRATGVATVLTGAVRRSGQQVRISAELARAGDNSVLWSFSAERSNAEIVELQRDIVDSIAKRIVGLAGDHQGGRRLVDPRSYDLVLRARYAVNSLSRDGLDRGLALYDSALTIDATLVDALIGKAFVYSALSDGFEHPNAVMPKASEFIGRAMSIDSTRADVLAAAATHTAGYAFDWSRAQQLVAAARRRDPLSIRAMFAQYMVHTSQANVPAAMALLDSMVKVDPLDPLPALNQIYLPVMMGDRVSAERAWARAPDFVKSVTYGDVGAAMVPLVSGRHAEALQIATAQEPTIGHPSSIGIIALARMGRGAEARTRLQAAERAWERSYSPPEMIAWAAAEVGDTTAMYKWLEIGNRERSAWRLFIGIFGGKIGSHRAEPHYQALLTSYGIKGLPPTP
ncbi:MAG: protein kinase [Gemmatimonadaceae bacterium]|nr:protein kinase [Gemmatimonadaceae bacterium]